MASWLVRSSPDGALHVQTPGRGHRVVILGKKTLLSTLIVPLSTQVYFKAAGNRWKSIRTKG